MRGVDGDMTSGLEAELYTAVAGAPIVSPHGHVDPALFADAGARFRDPAELLVVPDHYLLRMLYSQGVPLESLGVAGTEGAPVEADPRRIWQTFADHIHLFRGTPSAWWLRHVLRDVFGITDKLTPASAGDIYDRIDEQLRTDAFAPRALYERFGIEVLCTTDAATDTLEHHAAIRASDWAGTVLPTFRPDAVVAIDAAGWRTHLDRLVEVSGVGVGTYAGFLAALEQRREHFRESGATATDHGVASPYTELLSAAEAETIYQRALRGEAFEGDAVRFRGHLLCEMARMSCDDGLVMQIHAGVHRDHNPVALARYGRNVGGDIPLATEWTQNLRPLLERYGNHPNLRLVLFSLDESPYARELAPLAGHYPALRVGPPWWFHDSWNGMRRWFDRVIETAGLYNTAGFNDDTRAYPSIPARHDLWRRASARWVAGLVADELVDGDDAWEMMADLAHHLARDTYRLPGRTAGRLPEGAPT